MEVDIMSNVPKLRFKEFSGEWEENNLKKLSELITKGTTPKKFSNSGITFVKIEGINNLSINKDKCLFIDENTHNKELKRSILKEQDILFAIAGSLGKVAVVTKNILPANTNQALSIIRLKNKDYLNYILFVLQSQRMKKYIYKNLSVGAQPNLSLEQIGNFNFFLPLKQEQEKIASFLTSVDTRIKQLTKKEELLQQYKKGVMQKIFNQEIRFKADDGSEFCDWEETKLNNFLIERVDYPKNVLPIYSLTIENGIIPKSERYERAFLVKDDYEYKTMKKDDFAFNPMNLRFGALARHKKDLDVMVSKYYNIFYCNEKLNAYFAELYFTNYDSIQYYNKMATGSLEEKKRVHFKEFLKFRFEFPCLEEQNKIANFLYSIDTKIQQTQKQLELSKEFKKALLQQMFI